MIHRHVWHIVNVEKFTRAVLYWYVSEERTTVITYTCVRCGKLRQRTLKGHLKEDVLIPRQGDGD